MDLGFADLPHTLCRKGGSGFVEIVQTIEEILLVLTESKNSYILFTDMEDKSKKNKLEKTSLGILSQFKFNELASFLIPNISYVNLKMLFLLADKMIKHQRKLQKAKIESYKSLLQQHIDILNFQINRVIYKLYSLIEE